MTVILLPLLQIMNYILIGYKGALLIYALLSWLYLFGVVRPDNELIGLILGVLQRLIEPLLTPLRSVIPSPGGLDLSFFVLFLATHMLSQIVRLYVSQLTLETSFLG
tara:strand:+ start:167 stop:487 length:321 start_codon:yes stop_codon:yes gene_type:complete